MILSDLVAIRTNIFLPATVLDSSGTIRCTNTLMFDSAGAPGIVGTSF